MFNVFKTFLKMLKMFFPHTHTNSAEDASANHLPVRISLPRCRSCLNVRQFRHHYFTER